MQKGFTPILILVGVLILALVAGGAYYFGKSQISKPQPQNTNIVSQAPQPTSAPDETASWKTYTNKKDGISFKYPSDWKLTIKENTYTGYDEVTVTLAVEVSIPDQPGKTAESIDEEFHVYPVKDTGKAQFTNSDFTAKKLIDNVECKGRESEGSPQVAPFRYYECITGNINFGISLTSVKNNYSNLDKILSTFKFLDQNKTSVAPNTNAKVLTYNLPSGWQTVKDSTEKLEVGYDPEKYEALVKEKRIELSGKWTGQGSELRRLGWNRYIYLSSYSGGSRHNEVYKFLNLSPSSAKSQNYSEKEYNYNNWSCLVLNGLDADPSTWAFCPSSSTEGLLIGFDVLDWAGIERQLAAIKILK